MPNYEIHRKVGFFASLIIGIILSFFLINQVSITIKSVIFTLLVITFYSNLPDIDHHMGRLRKRTLTIIFSALILSSILIFFVNTLVFILVLSIIGFLGLSLTRIRHRGPMHSYPFVILASLPLLKLHWVYFVLALTCSSSHIFIDRLLSGLKNKVRKAFGIENKTHNVNSETPIIITLNKP